MKEQVMEMINEKKNEIKSLFSEKAIIHTKEIKAKNISSSQVQGLLDKKIITRVSRGLYSLNDGIDDPYFELQSKYKKIIYSHETALSLHELTDVTPANFFVTVPRNYNYQYLIKTLGIRVRRANLQRYELGIEEVLSPFGNIIKVYNREKTLCDIVANRNKMDPRILNEALKNYFSSNTRKNLNQLMKYGKILKVDRQIRQYMEVLL